VRQKVGQLPSKVGFFNWLEAPVNSCVDMLCVNLSMVS
jgi:hypothetical protein